MYTITTLLVVRVRTERRRMVANGVISIPVTDIIEMKCVVSVVRK